MMKPWSVIKIGPDEDDARVVRKFWTETGARGFCTELRKDENTNITNYFYKKTKEFLLIY